MLVTVTRSGQVIEREANESGEVPPEGSSRKESQAIPDGSDLPQNGTGSGGGARKDDALRAEANLGPALAPDDRMDAGNWPANFSHYPVSLSLAGAVLLGTMAQANTSPSVRGAGTLRPQTTSKRSRGASDKSPRGPHNDL